MAGFKTIFGRDGIPITDVRASVVRSSLLNDIGEAVFMIATSSVKCRREYLNYGNYIVVQHESLPPWVGVIDPPRVWRNGYVEIHAFEVPFLLQYRFPPLNMVISGSPGERFQRLLDFANDQADTLLRARTVMTTGAATEETVSESVYSHIKRISDANNFDWICSPIIDSDGSLTVAMDWLERAGNVTDLELTQGKNILYGDVPLEESGELISFVEAVSDPQEGGALTSSYSVDAEYGLRAVRNIYTGSLEATALAAYATEAVNKNKQPSLSTPLTVVDYGSTFENIRLGNIAKYKYSNLGFSETGLGMKQHIRIEGFRFDESLGTCELFTGKV